MHIRSNKLKLGPIQNVLSWSILYYSMQYTVYYVNNIQIMSGYVTPNIFKKEEKHQKKKKTKVTVTMDYGKYMQIAWLRKR